MAPTENSYGPPPEIPELPDYLADALKRSKPAWSFFQKLAPTDRRPFVSWIHLAKRPETHERRIREAITLLEAGRKLGLK